MSIFIEGNPMSAYGDGRHRRDYNIEAEPVVVRARAAIAQAEPEGEPVPEADGADRAQMDHLAHDLGAQLGREEDA